LECEEQSTGGRRLSDVTGRTEQQDYSNYSTGGRRLSDVTGRTEQQDEGNYRRRFII
jgi:hypothetical protein